MKNALALAVLLAASAVASLPVHAAAPTPQSVEKMLLLAKFGDLGGGINSQVDRTIDTAAKQVLQNKPATPAQQKIIDDLKAQTKPLVTAALSWDNVKTIYIKIYSANFTQEQIDGLIAFYQTPTGQAFAAQRPLLEQQVQEALQPQTTPMVIRLQMTIRDGMMKLRVASMPPTPPALLAKPVAKPASPASPAAAPAPATSAAVPAKI